MPNYKQPRKSLSVAERDRRKLAALENARRLLRYESTNNPPLSNLPPPSDRLGNEDDFLAGVDPLISDFGEDGVREKFTQTCQAIQNSIRF
jgi:hypothetical protein